MNLRAVLVVAFGPALTACQVQVATDEALPVQQGTASSTFSSQDDWAPGFLGTGTRSSCVKMPKMPEIFKAERVFFSIFNTIKFMDRDGKEFGYVQSWASDWKNFFGYAGASFYLKAEETQGSDGVWRIDGPTTGEDGTFADNSLTQEGLADNENQMFGQEGNQLGANNQVRQEEGRGWWDLLFRGSEDMHHRLAAFMVGSHEGPVGNPFKDDMTIRDCNGEAQVKAHDGSLVFRNAKDARVVQQLDNTENTLILRDRGTPPMDLVRVTAKEPCSPFPPFCAQMGQWNWFIHANEWEGHVVTPGTTNDMGGTLPIPDLTMTVSMSSGESEDIRFLTLYSAYQFANTRWSPFMNWVWFCLIVIPALCCCFRCCCRSADETPEGKNEETEKLMQTMEIKEESPLEKREGGFLACCSRRGGRGVAAN